MRLENNFGKVVVRTKDRRVYQGFSKGGLIGEKVQLIDEKGNQQEFELEELKAVFFVRDFAGDSSYKTVRFHRGGEVSPWLWVHVTFTDGEVLEGRVRNGLGLFEPHGFYVRLSDEGANSELVFVVRSAIRDFRIVGMA